MDQKRDNVIDNLRAIAMIGIVLAHCGGPLIINNLRSFDVITLVFLSSYMISIDKPFSFKSYEADLVKRAKRLFIPTLVFIMLMTSMQFIVYTVVSRRDLLTIQNIINSFLLCEDSIGYVWIIKVYFVNFMLSPVIILILRKIKYMWQYLLLLFVGFGFYSLCEIIYSQYSNSYISWLIIGQWLLCCMFYMLVSIDSIYFKMNTGWKKRGIIFWGLLFIATCFFYKGNFYFAPALDKRPAGIQYLAYGMIVTYLLYLILPKKEIKFFKWISINSMTIYYSHTFFIFGMGCIQSLLEINQSYFWIIQFFVALIGAVCCTRIIEIIKRKLF